MKHVLNSLSLTQTQWMGAISCLLFMSSVLGSLWAFNNEQYPLFDDAKTSTLSAKLTQFSAVCRVPVSRNTCDARIRRAGGYCVCSGRLAVPAKRKRRSNITCDHLCAASPAESARKIPELAKCSKGALHGQMTLAVATALHAM